MFTNLLAPVIQPPSNNVAQYGYQWIQGLAEVVKILAVFGGALTGGYFSHRLLLRRDALGRKKAFVGFLKRWKAQISPVSRDNRGGTTPSISVAESVYDSNVGHFWEKVEAVRHDYSDSGRFDALTSRLGSLKPDDWKDKKPKDVILYALDELIKFAA